MTLHRSLIAVLSLSLALAVSAEVSGQQQSRRGRRQAQPGKELPHPPAVGEDAPEFKLKNLKGKPVSLKKLTETHTVVLLVLRGWPGYQCPICSRQVGEFLQKKDEFAKLGAQLVLIYPGPSDLLAKHAEEFQGDRVLPDHFHYVIDPDYVFTNAWGLRWEAERETAYPSTFIIGRDRKVKFGVTSTTHGDRARAVTVLKELAKMKE